MRTKNEATRARLLAALRRRSPVGAAALAEEAGVSPATLHRLLDELGTELVATGQARRTRYALRRPLRGSPASLPLYEIDGAGRAEALAELTPVRPEGTCLPLAGTGWPIPEEARDGWWPGLPYPLQDMRPTGYMGRQFARAEHRGLQVAADPMAWSDDDVLFVLAQRGADTSGNLILGDAAFERWQSARVAGLVPAPSRALGALYAGLAEQAVAAGVPGSSAAGEFPKFGAVRERAGSATPHVLVKFSGAGRSAAERRWADLLICEHLALQGARGLPGIESARSAIVEHGGRTFLEVERFDRQGDFGRTRLVSLASVDAAFIGSASSDWLSVVARLVAGGWLGAAEAARIEHAWWYGRLIANTDMHTANLSFRVEPGGFALAPLYDMLPMLHAPLAGGEVPPRSFEPPLPRPGQRAVWAAACTAALAFWDAAAGDSRISVGFARICAGNAKRLRQAADSAV